LDLGALTTLVKWSPDKYSVTVPMRLILKLVNNNRKSSGQNAAIQLPQTV